MFFKPQGLLFEEPNNLMKQELREPGLYNTIIGAVATGSSKLNEIVTKIDILAYAHEGDKAFFASANGLTSRWIAVP